MSTASVFPILQKPRHRDRCNRCGECCRMVPCALAKSLVDQHAGACMALEYHADGTTSCGIIEHPFRYTTAEKLAKVVDYLKIEWPHLIPSNAPAALAIRLSLGNGTCDSYDIEE